MTEITGDTVTIPETEKDRENSTERKKMPTLIRRRAGEIPGPAEAEMTILIIRLAAVEGTGKDGKILTRITG